ncbi:MAG: tetratricopeptide repeat protein [Xanthomonadales bacterium]|nr:tetratricopeptide repeat protein [Xanthomonadales bacterium]
MNKFWLVATGAFVFASGIGTGMAAKKALDASAYVSMDKAAAGKALLAEALAQAGKGSWERIGVGRVYLLAGMKAEAKAIFDGVLVDPDASDVLRIARAYREAGDWASAKPLFDRFIAENPKEKNDIAEIGAYTMLAGDRAGAEALYAKSFALGEEFWATLAAGAGYLGVAPQD